MYFCLAGVYFNLGSGKPIIFAYTEGDSKMKNELWNYTEELL